MSKFKSMNKIQFEENISGGFSNREAKGKLPTPLPDPLRLNLGCGKDVKPGWVNIDLFSDNPDVVKMDIRRLDIADNAADEILASDILEHFSHREVDLILIEWARVLKPGGIIEIRCPNLKLQINAYMRGDWNADVASYMIFGGQTNPGDYHCVAFDENSIRQHLLNAGFELISYDEHDFPQNHGFINLNMTVIAKKPIEKIDYYIDEDVNDPFYGLDFDNNDNNDDTQEYAEHTIENADDALFDISLLEEIISMDSDKNKSDKAKHINLIWEGSQFVYHSLALINRELSLNLAKVDGIELSLVPFEPDKFHHSDDPRFEELLKYDIRFKEDVKDDVGKLPYLWVRHQWPPKNDPPQGAKWIIMQPWEYNCFLKEFTDTFKNADEIWTPSTFSRDAFIRSGIDEDKIQVIPNGINPDIFKPNGDKYDLGTEKKLKLLFVGGTIFRKGIDILLKSYTKMFTAKDDISLIIKDFGSNSFYKGQTAKGIIDDIKKFRNSPEIIHIEDELTERELASLYRSCDILVSPYRGEGFNLPAIEAMACGLPLVITKGGASDDFVTDDIAWLIDSEQVSFGYILGKYEFTEEAFILEPNEESLSLTLRAIYDNPNEINSAGLLASYYARKHHTWENAAIKILQRIDAIYDTDIAKNAKGKYYETIDAYIYLGRAEKLYSDGDPENAYEYFKEALKFNDLQAKHIIHALNRMAVIALNRGNYDECEKMLNKGRELEPEHPDLLYVQSLLYAGKNQNTEALETIAPLMENWINWKYESSFGYKLDDLLVLTGDILLNSGDLESANQLYTSALEINHENAFACYGAGICFMQAGIEDSAKEMLEWAVQLMPNFELARKVLEELN